SGRVNLAALSILSEQFDKLVEEKITRVVLSWSKDAPKVDPETSRYLSQYSNYAGRESNRNQDERFPVLTTGLQEVHLANIPGSRYSYGNRQTIHDDPQTAVAAAIWTALEILPAEELVREIKDGHPLIRAAALSAGGARLAPDHLSLVLEHLQNQDDPLMQQAAAYALRHFGDPAAVKELSTLVLSKDEKLSKLAVSSLSQSRYQSARDELKNLLGRVTGDDRKRLARELANSPAPDWADLYLENVNNPGSEIRVESLQALDRLGHEKLLPLLKQCLEEDDEALKNAAFSLVLNRNEPELESVLEKLVLEKLADGPPDGNLQNYLRRTKNAAAVPILIEQLKKYKEDSGKRQTLIQILSEIGDDRVASLFIELYKDLSENEQAGVLTALSQMQSPRFIELASAALRSEHSSLLYSAMNNLARTDSSQAEEILIDAFDKLPNKGYVDNLANLLAQIGSPEAEAKLRQGRESDVPEIRRASLNALRTLERQKPGYNYTYQARYQMRSKKWDQALQYAEMSIAMDETYAPAHAVKGTIFLQL
ncbi:MAG TPA: HEAT repeat domain-containing protein, partial [Planctomycetaceae bacterium]|nr:HEAT repeat domain-containing protein [Planctomycetaceae bacterium]